MYKKNKLLLIILIVIVIIIIWMMYKSPNNKVMREKYGCKQCEREYKKSSEEREQRKGLLPLMDPGFNLRETAKQMILLEDHLFNARKRCMDCQQKHCLTIEGLIEEAITLDKNQQYKALLEGLPDKARQISKMVARQDEPLKIAQYIRSIRKELANACFPQVLEYD